MDYDKELEKQEEVIFSKFAAAGLDKQTEPIIESEVKQPFNKTKRKIRELVLLSEE